MTTLLYDTRVWQAAVAFIIVAITSWIIATRKQRKPIPAAAAPPNAPAVTSSPSSAPSSTPSLASAPAAVLAPAKPSSISPKMKMLQPLLSSYGISSSDQIISDGHVLYESSRSLWNACIDKKPLAFVRVNGVMDVIHTIKYATERKIAISVKGGGHNIAGTALVHGGIVIDMHHMRAVHVDVEQSLVRVQGGATWQHVDRECAIHGLAVVGGLISSTGVVGLAIGGGIGWLSRTYGLSCDSIIAIDIVLANGVAITATCDNAYADLFWCHHGGGGNFGVVTCVTFRAHRLRATHAITLPSGPASPSPSGIARSSSISGDEYDAPVGYACLQWPIVSSDLLIAFDALAASLPSTVAAYCFLQRFPSPSAATGSDSKSSTKDSNPLHTIMMFVNNHGMIYGDKERYTHHDASILESQLVTLLGDLIALHAPRSMDITVLEYTQLQCMFDEGSPFGDRWRWKSAFVHNDITSVMATDIIACLQSAPSGTSLEIQRLRGSIITCGINGETKHGRRDSATAAVANNHSVFGHRDAYYEMHTISRWKNTALDERMAAFAKVFESTMAPHIGHDDIAGYANYYTHDTNNDAVRASFGVSHYEQLQAAKLKYDPTNVFASNQNISLPPPASSSSTPSST